MRGSARGSKTSLWLAFHVPGMLANAADHPAVGTPGSAAPGGCIGDCNDSGAVTINEIIRGVAIVFGITAVSDCPAFDPHNTGVVDVTAIVQAVNADLGGCLR